MHKGIAVPVLRDVAPSHVVQIGPRHRTALGEGPLQVLQNRVASIASGGPGTHNVIRWRSTSETHPRLIREDRVEGLTTP